MKVLIAGATGYLGTHMVTCAKDRGYWVRTLVRSESQKLEFEGLVDEVFVGQITKPETLNGVADGIDIVFSSVGITKQKDNMRYLDVDYNGNLNLLNEALKSNVKKFVYVSVFNADKISGLKVIEAKELFVKALRASSIQSVVIRPNGFFSDMNEVLNMAKKGTVYLLGDGSYKFNPISGSDLANACCNCFERNDTVLNIGGPNTYSANEIAKLAFKAIGAKERIVHIPLWLVNVSIYFLRIFTSSKIYGPIEFFGKMITIDMVSPQYGVDDLFDYFVRGK